jgi:hypothetical protein
MEHDTDPVGMPFDVPGLLLQLLLVILHFGIDGPDVVLCGDAVDDILNGGHGGQHRVILIVVFVHSVAAN